MYALLLTFLLFSGDLTNSHKVMPLTQLVERPVVEEKLPTWEVAASNRPLVYVQATKLMVQGDLFLLADDEEEIIFACHKSVFIYARKMKKDEKVP